MDGMQNELQVSAADYDPSKDHREDQERRARHNAAALAEIRETADVSVGFDEGKEEGSNEEDDEFDMFSMDTGPKKKRKAFVR